MKTTSTIMALLLGSTLAFSFDFSSAASTLLESQTKSTKTTEKTAATTDNSSLSNSVVTDGLKEALKLGVDYGVKALGQKDGYLNNAAVKIPLPDNLAKAETIIRSAGGDKVADDLINSMNAAATEAAPKTAEIFVDAIDKMSIDDAKNILAGGDNAATEYFETHTSTSLKELIKPIVQKSMEDNSVAKYYNTANEFYKNNLKETVESSSVMGMAKSFGADAYLPSDSDEGLDDFVTNKAISGLFTMIAAKEGEIRSDPVAQTTSLLKSVFGN